MQQGPGIRASPCSPELNVIHLRCELRAEKDRLVSIVNKSKYFSVEMRSGYFNFSLWIWCALRIQLKEKMYRKRRSGKNDKETGRKTLMIRHARTHTFTEEHLFI